jgi:hypothetical protein
MGIEGHPDFPRFNMVSTVLRDAEERLLRALKSGDEADIVAAKLALMGALDEYSKIAKGIGENPPDYFPIRQKLDASPTASSTGPNLLATALPKRGSRASDVNMRRWSVPAECRTAVVVDRVPRHALIGRAG